MAIHWMREGGFGVQPEMQLSWDEGVEEEILVVVVHVSVVVSSSVEVV
jgi:hypothetical protein